MHPGSVHLAQACSGNRRVRKFLEQLIGRRSQLGFNGFQGSRVAECREVILKSCQLIQPVSSNQIGTGGECLSHFDETGAQVGESAQKHARQISLHLRVTAVPPDQQVEHQPGQCPENLKNARHRDPGTQQKPASITARVVPDRFHVQIPNQRKILESSINQGAVVRDP